MLLLAATLLTTPLRIAPGIDPMPIVAPGNAVPMPTSPGESTVAMPNAVPGRYREDALREERSLLLERRAAELDQRTRHLEVSRDRLREAARQ